jgi:hypothetical protein
MEKLNEKDLVAKAKETMAVDEEIRRGQLEPGKPLPSNVVNPLPGSAGHYCLDPNGNYQPKWMSLRINRTSEDMPSRQPFNLIRGDKDGKPVHQRWNVKLGIWVDVPPEIIQILGTTEVEEVSFDIRNANPITDDGAQVVTKRIPRFSYSVMPSA